MININKYIKEDLLKVRVTPHSSRTELIEKNNQLHLYLKSPPEKDKANKELIKFFKKQFPLKVKIKSGAKSRDKVLEVVQ